MQKARSRLHPPTPIITPVVISQQSTCPPTSIKATKPTHSGRSRSYLIHFPTLVLATIFWIMLGYLVTHYYPQQLINFLLPGWYLPIILLFFTASFFSASFLLLNSRRGLMISWGLTTILWFKLQQVQFDWPLVLTFSGCWLILSLANEWLTRRHS